MICSLTHKHWLIPTTPTNPPLIYAAQTHADHCLVLQLAAHQLLGSCFSNKKNFWDPK